MLEFLRDGAWQGVGGIIASISLLLYVFVERKKIFAKANKITSFTVILSIWSILLVLVSSAVASGTLGIGAGLIITGLINGLIYPLNIIITSMLLGFGLGSFFTIIHFLLLRDALRNQNVYILFTFFGFIGLGIINATQMALFYGGEDKVSLANILFEWARGAFLGGLCLTVALYVDKNLDVDSKSFKSRN